MLNALVEGRERDCLWRHAGLVVELDSREYHDDDEAFDTDRRRDRALLVAGWKVVRVTWRHLLEEERELADDLRRLTATNGPDV
jgi:very-short-patch-repair endonuclease